MKIYISVDIEGICGITTWDEATKGNAEYPEFQKQMIREVNAACEGAFKAGATAIFIRDAHDTACNIIADDLPEKTVLVRGWSQHPYMMMQELDGSFDAVLMLGYHSLAGGGGNPLAHTMSTRISSLVINDRPASEFLINYYTTLLEKVPVAVVSGDRELCDHAAVIAPGITTVPVKTGSGNSTINIHPKRAAEMTRTAVYQALSDGDKLDCLQELPERFSVTISYTTNQDSYKAAHYPGARLISPRVVGFESDNYFDVLRLFLFTL